MIVPKVTLKKWQKEFHKWFPDCRVFMFYGLTGKEEKELMKENEMKKREFDVLLTTFEMVI